MRSTWPALATARASAAAPGRRVHVSRRNDAVPSSAHCLARSGLSRPVRHTGVVERRRSIRLDRGVDWALAGPAQQVPEQCKSSRRISARVTHARVCIGALSARRTLAGAAGEQVEVGTDEARLLEAKPCLRLPSYLQIRFIMVSTVRLLGSALHGGLAPWRRGAPRGALPRTTAVPATRVGCNPADRARWSYTLRTAAATTIGVTSACHCAARPS